MTDLLCIPRAGGAVCLSSRCHQFSLADLRHHKNIYLHREQVRDIKFSSNGGSIGYVLSTSFDKTLKVICLLIRFLKDALQR